MFNRSSVAEAARDTVTIRKLQAIAHHEAGHAVAALKQGMKLKQATIKPGADFLGKVTHRTRLHGIDYDLSNANLRRVEKVVVFLFAGPAAQRRFNPGSWRKFHGQSDFETAADLALYVSGSDVETDAFLERMHQRATELVARNWADIEHVADQLLKHRTLSRLTLSMLPSSTHVEPDC